MLKMLKFGMSLNKFTVNSHLELYLGVFLHPPKSIEKLRKIQRKATEVISDMKQLLYDEKPNLEKTQLREDIKSCSV